MYVSASFINVHWQQKTSHTWFGNALLRATNSNTRFAKNFDNEAQNEQKACVVRQKR